MGGGRLRPLRAGERAPDFSLPGATRDETVSLADYRGRCPVFLALFPGVWCPFCRRAIAQMGRFGTASKTAGVEALGIVASAPHNARLYFKYRPTRLRLAADPEMVTHRAYGVPKPVATPELLAQMAATRINPTGELPEPLPILEAGAALTRADEFVPTETDQAEMQAQWPQLKGQFLIDRDGIVRWRNIECAKEGLAGAGKFPMDGEILTAIRALPA